MKLFKLTTLFASICCMNVLFAQDWDYNSNDYEFTASMTAAIDGHTDDTGDILAAFDADGNVRGVSAA